MLSDLICRRARARDKAYKLADERGLYLFVTPSGFRSWRVKYRVAGKEKTLTLGPYPEVSLSEARIGRDEARRLLRAGVDPGEERKRAAVTTEAEERTFRVAALAWHANQLGRWEPAYAAEIWRRLENDALPALGKLPLASITAAKVLETVRAVESRGAIEMAHRLRQYISDVFVFAIGSSWTDQDPAAVVVKALRPPTRRLRPAVTSIEAARQVLARSEAQPSYASTRLAARLLALTAARPGVVRLAAPAEFEDLDGEEPVWRVPAAKMKLTREQKMDVDFEFVIPLSRQAVELVRVALALGGAHARLLFPSVKHSHRPMSDSTLSKLYRDAGFAGVHVPHGWRATFSTLMNRHAALNDREREREVIDLMLAHLQAGVEPIYNRYLYMPQRRVIAQRWADMLVGELPPPSALIEGQRGSSARAARRRARDARGTPPLRAARTARSI